MVCSSFALSRPLYWFSFDSCSKDSRSRSVRGEGYESSVMDAKTTKRAVNMLYEYGSRNVCDLVTSRFVHNSAVVSTQSSYALSTELVWSLDLMTSSRPQPFSAPGPD